MSCITDVLQAGKVVADLLCLLAGDVVSHRLDHAHHGEDLLPLRKQPFLLALGQWVEIKGSLLELVVADLTRHVVAAINTLELLLVLFGKQCPGKFSGFALVALQAPYIVTF